MYDSSVENASTLGQRIKRARYEAGLSQFDLADKMGVSPRAVQYWESPTGRRQPQARQLRRLSAATGKPLEWFFAPPVEDAA
jgi:transcriptional regulator with XRE-family HTH domain